MQTFTDALWNMLLEKKIIEGLDRTSLEGKIVSK